MSTTEHRVWYVQCPQFTSEPTTYAKAKYLAESLNKNQHACFEPHRIIKITQLVHHPDTPEHDPGSVSDAS